MISDLAYKNINNAPEQALKCCGSKPCRARFIRRISAVSNSTEIRRLNRPSTTGSILQRYHGTARPLPDFVVQNKKDADLEPFLCMRVNSVPTESRYCFHATGRNRRGDEPILSRTTNRTEPFGQTCSFSISFIC